MAGAGGSAVVTGVPEETDRWVMRRKADGLCDARQRGCPEWPEDEVGAKLASGVACGPVDGGGEGKEGGGWFW